MSWQPAQLRRAILTPLAAQHGLDYDREYLAPSFSPEALAFAFVGCGADVALGFSYADGFPGVDRKTRLRGARAAANGLAHEGGQQAAIYLASALAIWHQRLAELEGDHEAAGYHERFGVLIADAYPLAAHVRAKLDGLSQEYLVLQTHEAPREVRTGYHMALADPGYSEHENVDDDTRLVESQTAYAGNYLRQHATVDAIEMIVGTDEMSKLPGMLHIGGFGGEYLVLGVALHTGWASVTDDWLRHGRRALDETPRPEPLDDEIAEFLRRRIMVFISIPTTAMPDMAAEHVAAFARQMAANDADYWCLTDALLYGYLLRRAEEDLIEYPTLSDDAVKRLRRAYPDPEEALIAATATVSEMLPGFSARPAAWEDLLSWAANRAFERAVQRSSLDMTDALQAVFIPECQQAFAYGYALRAGFTSLYDDPA